MRKVIYASILIIRFLTCSYQGEKAQDPITHLKVDRIAIQVIE